MAGAASKGSEGCHLLMKVSTFLVSQYLAYFLTSSQNNRILVQTAQAFEIWKLFRFDVKFNFSFSSFASNSYPQTELLENYEWKDWYSIQVSLPCWASTLNLTPQPVFFSWLKSFKRFWVFLSVAAPNPCASYLALLFFFSVKFSDFVTFNPSFCGKNGSV